MGRPLKGRESQKTCPHEVLMVPFEDWGEGYRAKKLGAALRDFL